MGTRFFTSSAADSLSSPIGRPAPPRLLMPTNGGPPWCMAAPARPPRPPHLHGRRRLDFSTLQDPPSTVGRHAWRPSLESTWRTAGLSCLGLRADSRALDATAPCAQKRWHCAAGASRRRERRRRGGPSRDRKHGASGRGGGSSPSSGFPKVSCASPVMDGALGRLHTPHGALRGRATRFPWRDSLTRGSPPGTGAARAPTVRACQPQTPPRARGWCGAPVRPMVERAPCQCRFFAHAKLDGTPIKPPWVPVRQL